jgi:predicted HTH transcriptional regulator
VHIISALHELFFINNATIVTFYLSLKSSINYLNMPENQNIEWKESWRDEYLKWICGFANAKGGVIVIGQNR